MGGEVDHLWETKKSDLGGNQELLRATFFRRPPSRLDHRAVQRDWAKAWIEMSIRCETQGVVEGGRQRLLFPLTPYRMLRIPYTPGMQYSSNWALVPGGFAIRSLGLD